MVQRKWQLFFSLGYVGLFLFLFVVKTAPEQRLRATISIEAPAEQVASVLKTGRPIQTLVLTGGAGQAPARLATATDDLAALLLTKSEWMNVSIHPEASRTMLTVETHWQVHGGLLGKALDRVIGRPARVKALTASLRRLKAQAEEQRKAQA